MRIAILGAAGSIGQALSLLLKINLPKNSEIFLYDISPITYGISIDLNHIPNSTTVIGFSGNDINHALQKIDIVLIAAGMARKIGMNRNDLLKFNIDIIKNLILNIGKYSPNALIGIITNPVNILTIIAAKILKKIGIKYKNKLFGITKLDIIRSQYLVSQMKNLEPENIHIPVICGHSQNTIVPIFSQITPKINFQENEYIELTKSLQEAGDQVLKYKNNQGSATLSMAQAAASFTYSLVKALQGKKNIIEYAYVEGNNEYAKFFAQPIMLGKKGIIKYLKINKFNEFEQNLLYKALKKLKVDIALGEIL